MASGWSGDERRRGRSAAELNEYLTELRREWEVLRHVDANGENERESAYGASSATTINGAKPAQSHSRR